MKAIWTKIKELWLKVRSSKLFWEVIGVCVFLLAIWIIVHRLQNKNAQLELEKHVLTDQMTSYKDKDGLNVSRIEVLESEKAKNLLKIKSKDSTVLFLQGEVEKYKKQIKEPGSSVTTVTSTTNVSGTVPSTVIPPTSIDYDASFAGYYSEKHTEWIDLVITAKKDSTHFDLKSRNKYSVVIGYEKGVPFAQVKNFNPYTETTSLRTFQVTVPKQKRLGIGLQGGYGIGANGLTPYFGVGISYNLFYIK